MTNDYAQYIDHTLLKPEATKVQIDQLIEEAIEYQFASVCVNPSWVSYCYRKLKNSTVKVCTVVGFPLGATSTETKVFETKKAIEDGATEIDMVIPIGPLKSGDYSYVEEDIRAVNKSVNNRAITKVIIETALLNEDEKIKVCQIAKDVGVDFVKTSTGFASKGATINDVQLMREVVGSKCGVKASGGIRDLKTMQLMIEAGANRIGASAGVDILNEASS